MEFQFLMKAEYGTSVTMIKDIPKILMCNKDHKILYGFYRQILCMNKTLCIILLIIPFMQGIHIGPTTSLWLLRVLYSCCLCKKRYLCGMFSTNLNAPYLWWKHDTTTTNFMNKCRYLCKSNNYQLLMVKTRIYTSKRIYFKICIHHKRLRYIFPYKNFYFWQPIR